MSFDFTVSVIMITYKHEKFIKNAIDGVLSQNFEGNIELIISDDLSPDNTKKIVESYTFNTSKNIIIKYIQQNKNLGMLNNFLWTLKQAKGKYISICEGDDYWIDNFKIQKQVDFLEKNMDYSICGGLARVEKDGVVGDLIYGEPNKSFILKDFLLKNNLVTCTVLFRNNFKFQIPKDHIFCDWTIYMEILKHGKAYIFPDIFAVYRQHAGGIMSTVNYYSQYTIQYTYNFRQIKPNIKELTQLEVEEFNLVFIKYFENLLQKKQYLKALEIVYNHFRLMKKRLGYRRYLSLLNQ